MIKIYSNKLKNGNLEITEDMLNDILSYIKRQEKALDNFRPFTFAFQMKQENKVLKEKIKRLNNIRYDTLEFCNRYLSLNLDNFNADQLLKKIIEIQGSDPDV